jgi:hypothetical protein
MMEALENATRSYKHALPLDASSPTTYSIKVKAHADFKIFTYTQGAWEIKSNTCTVPQYLGEQIDARLIQQYGSDADIYSHVFRVPKSSSDDFSTQSCKITFQSATDADETRVYNIKITK